MDAQKSIYASTQIGLPTPLRPDCASAITSPSKPTGISALLTEEHRKEALGRAYLRAVAAQAGANIAIPEHDYGIDITMTEVVERNDNGKTRYVDWNDFKIQLKCSVSVTIETETIVYDLEAHTYNDLVGEPNTPRILVLLHVPREEADWLTLTEEQLVIRHCAYWISLRGQAPTANAAQQRIRIPFTQRFTSDTVQEIFERLRAGGLP